MGDDVFDVIFSRRSIGRLGEPAPTDDELTRMFEAAAAAPDHCELRPWRFVVLRGGAKDDFGEVLATAYRARCASSGAQPHPAKEEKERTKLGRAPVVVVVAAVRRDDPNVPWVEQQAAAAAATQNLLLAATALGYGSMWRTGEPAYDDRVKEALGLRPEDHVTGFVYLGTPRDGAAKPPRRPSIDDAVVWHPPFRP